MSEFFHTIIHEQDSANKQSLNELKKLLEKNQDEVKISVMKQIIVMVINGNTMVDLLMHIIRFVMPSKNKELKKLLYYYLEVCTKVDQYGKLKQEMILVCNSIQQDLQHPNEYIRGTTLRFLSKLKEPDLIEPLISNIKHCMEHRHAYVRKNAVFCLYSVHKLFPHMTVDTDEVIEQFLKEETDSICKRNGFVCLSNLNRNKALKYLKDSLPNIQNLDPLIQLAFIEFVRKDFNSNMKLRQSYIDLMLELVESPLNSVVFDAAKTLSFLTSDLSLIGIVCSKYIEVAVNESDNNIRLFMLDRINELNMLHPGILHDLTLDILSLLSCLDLNVHKKVLNIILPFISRRNIEDVFKTLQKEFQKLFSSDEEKSSSYRQVFISTIHQLAAKFPDFSLNFIELLLNSLNEFLETASFEILSFIKEIVYKFPESKKNIILLIINSLSTLKNDKIFKGFLWIISEYVSTKEDILIAWNQIILCIEKGLPSFPKKKSFLADQKNTDSINSSNHSKTLNILPDGTYAALNSDFHDQNKNKKEHSDSSSVQFFDNYFFVTTLCSTLLKLILKMKKIGLSNRIVNSSKAEALLVLVTILKTSRSSNKKTIDEDSEDKIHIYIKFLTDSENQELIEKCFLEDVLEAFKTQIKKMEDGTVGLKINKKRDDVKHVNDSIVFRQFDVSNVCNDYEEFNFDLIQKKKESNTSRLNKIIQLSGFSDPIYAEAYVKLHQYDIVLDILLVNQTLDTLRNLSIEFGTHGDSKVVDKPETINIGPHGFHKFQTVIKVNSATTGIVFGNIVYDGHHSNDSKIVIMNDIHIDVTDYIESKSCSEDWFRKMWNEFEWENKISIKAKMESTTEYLKKIMDETKMVVCDSGSTTEEDCKFLSSNLYARSLFGEDLLANLSVEKQDEYVIGHIKVRSRGQGLALSIGDKIASISTNLEVSALNFV